MDIYASECLHEAMAYMKISVLFNYTNPAPSDHRRKQAKTKENRPLGSSWVLLAPWLLLASKQKGNSHIFGACLGSKAGSLLLPCLVIVEVTIELVVMTAPAAPRVQNPCSAAHNLGLQSTVQGCRSGWRRAAHKGCHEVHCL